MPITSVAETISGGAAFGRISRSISRSGPAPSARAALTYSRRRRRMNSARASRAVEVHATSPIASTAVPSEGENSVISTIANSSEGMTWKTSVSRDRSSSTQPPR